MKKVITKILLFVIGVSLVLSPFVIFSIAANSQAHVYQNTYYAALVDKVHNLQRLKNEKKIVLVGGSNVAFGFNSELLEKEFPEYKVVNFGLYAMLGTKIMMDLAIDYIHEGDMVIVIPEINPQSTSLFFDPDSTLKALEDDMNIIWSLPKDNRESAFGAYFNFVAERSKQSKVIEPSGVYQRKNFNKYGDISYTELDGNGILYRAANRMTLHYDPTMMVDYSYTIDTSFFDYLNTYNETILKKKAHLYYSFSPVNEKSAEKIESLSDYYWQLRTNLACNVIGNPSEYLIDPHYFYDSNFHLNDAGAIYRSYLLAQDIYRDIYKTADKPGFSIPEKPSYADEGDAGEDSETANYFTYTEYEDSLLISGISAEHVDDETIDIPAVAKGKKVVGIAENAFKACTNINNLVIPSTIAILMDGCFGNAPSLTRVVIETRNPSDIIVSYTGSMTRGVSEDFKIYIHREFFTDFATDYYWGAYSSFFVGY